jgi:hypothetical protein
LFLSRHSLKKYKKKIGRCLVYERKGIPLLKEGECKMASSRVELPSRMSVKKVEVLIVDEVGSNNHAYF